MICSPAGATGGRLRVSAQVIGVGAVDCAHGTGPRALIGAVARAGSDTFVLDSRAPLENGSALLSTFTVAAPGFPGFDRYLTTGAFVRVDLEIRPAHPGACAARVLVQSLSAWQGQPSPSRSKFFFAGNDGLWEPFAAAPFMIARSKADCAGLAASARDGGKAIPIHTLSAPASAKPCRDDAWSYWIASALDSAS